MFTAFLCLLCFLYYLIYLAIQKKGFTFSIINFPHGITLFCCQQLIFYFWESIPFSPVKKTHSAIFHGLCWIITLLNPYESSFEALVLRWCVGVRTAQSALPVLWGYPRWKPLRRVLLTRNDIFTAMFLWANGDHNCNFFLLCSEQCWHCLILYLKVLNIHIPDGAKFRHLLQCTVGPCFHPRRSWLEEDILGAFYLTLF